MRAAYKFCTHLAGPSNAAARAWIATRLLQRTRHTDGLGRTTAYHWDARFNIIATVIAEGTPEQIIEQTPTDATGASTGRIDPLGRRTTLRRDARGNLVQIIGAMGHATTLQYNPLDLVTTLRDALGHEWQQEYDSRGHLVQATDPLGCTTRYRHDARGRTVEVIDAKGDSKQLAWMGPTAPTPACLTAAPCTGCSMARATFTRSTSLTLSYRTSSMN
ncbi:MAG: RHS repeat protein [Delftia sp.]|nr:RHS repeat protein [Delftia sp.]MCP4534967.1 RHS repeat protein [Delftia sp.]QPS78147.1 RHS repeat protein [Delftia acidovorans]